MAEISSSADKAAKALDELSAAAGKHGSYLINAGKERASEDAKARRSAKEYGERIGKFNRGTEQAGRVLSDLVDTGSQAAITLRNLTMQLLPGASALMGMVLVGANLTKTYQELTEVGQTFGGSMLRMAQEAGAAGLPLEQFARMLTQSSAAAAALGRSNSGGSLGALQRQVRTNIENFGLYGMTVEQITELTGEYAETLRLAGLIEGGSNQQRARAIADFAEDISAFAQVAGKSRREIAKATAEALRDETATARLRFSREDQRRSLERATAFFAALPGEMGNRIATMLTQTFGQGTALFTSDAKMFVEAGMSGFLTMVEDLNTQVRNGTVNDATMVDFARNFVSQVDEIEESLIIQVAAGNESARQMLRMRDQWRTTANLTERDIARMRADARQREMLTRFATSFDSIFKRIIGSFNDGFFGKIADAAAGLAARFDDGSFDDLLNTIRDIGEMFGSMLGDLFKPETITSFTRGMTDFSLAISSAFRTIGGGSGLTRVVGEFLKGVQGATIWFLEQFREGSAVRTAFAGVAQAISWVTSAFSAFHGMVTTLVSPFTTSGAAASQWAAGLTALGAFLLWTSRGGIWAAITNQRLRQMQVSANDVYINGQRQAGFGGATGSDDRRGGRGGRRAALGAGVAGAALAGGAMLLTDREESFTDIIGGVAGGALGGMVASGLGRIIGGGIGAFFGGPLGIAVGTTLGGLLGGWLSSFIGDTISDLWGWIRGTPTARPPAEPTAVRPPQPVQPTVTGGGMGIGGEPTGTVPPLQRTTQPVAPTPPTPPASAPAPDARLAEQVQRIQRQYEELVRERAQMRDQLAQAQREGREGAQSEMVSILRRLEDLTNRSVALLTSLAQRAEEQARLGR